VRVTAAQAEAVAELFEQLGAHAITSADGDLARFDEPGVDSGAVWQACTLTALFDAASDLARVRDAVHALLGASARVRETDLHERDWAEAWKEHWQPLVFADDLCVCPSWCEPPPDMRTVLRIDPGRAFGTGTHATTALCLDWLARAPDIVGRHVIDYGCGSGILALAARACGAARVEAIDIDRDALAVAADNARINGMAADISFAPARAAGIAPCDILIANILLEPLLALAPLFASLVRPGGRVALSGLLSTQVEQVLDAYGAAFTMLDTRRREDWVLLIGLRT